MAINSTNNNKTKNRLPKKIMTYDIGNPGPGLGQTLTCGGVKSINGIQTHHVHIIFIVLNHVNHFP